MFIYFSVAVWQCGKLESNTLCCLNWKLQKAKQASTQPKQQRLQECHVVPVKPQGRVMCGHPVGGWQDGRMGGWGQDEGVADGDAYENFARKFIAMLKKRAYEIIYRAKANRTCT